jgi:hypothetical protein
VQPGVIIQLDCIGERRRGNPGWRWRNTDKEYPTGQKYVSSKRGNKENINVLYKILQF